MAPMPVTLATAFLGNMSDTVVKMLHDQAWWAGKRAAVLRERGDDESGGTGSGGDLAVVEGVGEEQGDVEAGVLTDHAAVGSEYFAGVVAPVGVQAAGAADHLIEVAVAEHGQECCLHWPGRPVA